MKTLLKG